MRRLLVAAAIAVFLPVGGSSVQADILSLHGSLHGGGGGGMGIGGGALDDGHIAWFENANGATYGAILGAEVLFIDGWIEHNQFRDTNGLLGTWTQFMLGMDVKIDMGEQTEGSKKEGDDTGKLGGNRYSKTFAEFGFGFGFGVGTVEQFDGMLDYTDVTDRGFLVQVSAGIAYRITRNVAFGLRVPVQAGYMFRKGIANDASNQYRSIQAAALLELRLDFLLR